MSHFACAYSSDGTLLKTIPVDIVSLNVGSKDFLALVKKEEIPRQTEYLDFMPEFATAQSGEEGYMIVPLSSHDAQNCYMLSYFKRRDDYECSTVETSLPIFGLKRTKDCFVGIVTGMRCELGMVAGVKNGMYYTYPRFWLEGDGAYEDICVEYRFLYGEDADYSGMARTYRHLQLERGICIPLKERAKNNPHLSYATKSMNIRIRLAMKPIPSPVMEQTIETEPQMVVACTFDRLKELIDEFAAQKIVNAEFCLVGWNLKGHDGRYPDVFPVEEALGGEEKLREVIRYGQEKGYQMTCHTNSTDAYTIASMWNDDDILQKKDGSLSVDINAWSGGRMYQLCPQVAVKQAREVLPQVAGLGFKGIHYIDVITTVALRKCYNEQHKINRKQAQECNAQIMKLSKELFGGFSSEGGYDYNIGDLDFALSVHKDFFVKPEILDREVPLFELVYHGITLYGVSWFSTRFNAEEEPSELKETRRLKWIEYGGRPVAYFHQDFHGFKEEIGNGYSTAKGKMEKCVGRVKESFDDYQAMAFLQYEFMEKHEMLEDGIFKTTYSDGTTVIVDYNKLQYRIESID